MKKSIIAFLIFGLVSCANTNKVMPESNYIKFSTFAGMLQRCFNEGMISTKTYADTKTALSYTINTWSYDSNKLNTMMNNAYYNVNPTTQNCRQTEANAFQLISAVNKYDSNIQRTKQQNAEAWKNTLDQMNKNKPVYCNTIGSTTMCH